MQITRMFEQVRHNESGQRSVIKIQLTMRLFSIKTRSPGSNEVMVVEIELRRRDGQPVDPWLQTSTPNPNQ